MHPNGKMPCACILVHYTWYTANIETFQNKRVKNKNLAKKHRWTIKYNRFTIGFVGVPTFDWSGAISFLIFFCVIIGAKNILQNG
jgi:hypothetical protein